MVGASNDFFPYSMPLFLFISLNVKVHLREKSFHLLLLLLIFAMHSQHKNNHTDILKVKQNSFHAETRKLLNANSMAVYANAEKYEERLNDS